MNIDQPTCTVVLDKQDDDWVVEQIVEEVDGCSHSTFLYRGENKAKAEKLAEWAQDSHRGFQGEIPAFFGFYSNSHIEEGNVTND